MANSAKRLLKILQEGKSTEINKKSSCRQVWMKLLDVPNQDDILLLSRIGKTMALTGEIEKELKSLNNINVKSFLGWVPSINSAFSRQRMDSEWATFIDLIDEHTLNYLNTSSDILDSGAPLEKFDINPLLDLSASISELLSEILRSDLPSHVKAFMSSKLREIQIAIDEYHITGKGPIINAVESFVGQVILHQELKESSTDNNTADKFWGFMGKLLIITSLMANGLQIQNEVKKLLPPPTIIELENHSPDNDNSGTKTDDDIQLA